MGALLMTTWSWFGCTDAHLEDLPDAPPAPVDDALRVDGTVCTQPPDELVFPLRVLFLVDASESMEVSDPPDPTTGLSGREQAVLDVIDSLQAQGGDVRVSLVRFSAEAQGLTLFNNKDGTFGGYFTPDLDFARSQVPFLAETDRTTNFQAALSESYAEIRDELERTSLEARPLSTVHVVMFTDGIPDAESGDVASSNDAILKSVDGLVELESLYHISDLKLHTALLESGDPTVDAVASDLLSAMAEHGGGTYRSYADASSIDFLRVDFGTLQRVFTLSTLVASNQNAIPFESGFLPDSDGDGASDETERNAHSNPTVPDTDGDGCRDGIELAALGQTMDPTDPTDCDCFVPDACLDLDLDGLCDNGCTDADSDNLCDCIDIDNDGVCDPSNYIDVDGDGLMDCEERYSGTNRYGADSDVDGFGDFLEIRAGTSPDIDDKDDDNDWDSVTNGDEIRTGTDPQSVAELGRHDLALQYQVSEGNVQADGSTCTDFTIENITLVPMEAGHRAGVQGPAAEGYTGWNRVIIYAGEVPFDDPLAYARFRVACVEARIDPDGNYRDPPSGRITVTPDDFVDLATFNPDANCINRSVVQATAP